MKIGTHGNKKYNGKVIILNNEDTQSSAEFNTMAFRTYHNAIVIGSTTAGADGDVTEFYLPGGILTTISGIGVYYYNNKETQQIGILPDIVIKPTIKGIKLGQDELLNFAISKIK